MRDSQCLVIRLYSNTVMATLMAIVKLVDFGVLFESTILHVIPYKHDVMKYQTTADNGKRINIFDYSKQH